MTDVLTKAQRSYNMSMIKGRNTSPEIAFRKLLFANGFRGYRLHYKLAGKPDVVFPKYKIAIFIDGCFWHKCPGCFQKPATNRAFWKKKLDTNVNRDKTVNLALKKDKWKVVRLWEHEIRKDLNKCFYRVAKEISMRAKQRE